MSKLDEIVTLLKKAGYDFIGEGQGSKDKLLGKLSYLYTKPGLGLSVSDMVQLTFDEERIRPVFSDQVSEMLKEEIYTIICDPHLKLNSEESPSPC